MHSNFADFSICSPCCERTPGKKTRSCFCLACAHWPVNLCIATAVRDGKDKILLGWQAGNPSALCFQFYLQTEPTSYREESKCTCDAFSEHKDRWRFLSIFFFFFHKDGRKALNMNLLSYKTADVHLALDLKVNTKPEGHLVLPRMKIKV